MNIELREEFETVEQGTHYRLPCYEVVDGKGIQPTGNLLDLKFVRGSKLKDEEVERKEGTLHEHLLSAMIEDLQYKTTLVPSKEGYEAITKLQEALHWLRHRQIDRAKRNVAGTYQK